MKLATITTREISPQELARALAAATPNDFAQFWLEFSLHTDADDAKLLAFAKVMAPSFGAKRKESLRKLCSLIEYCEVQNGLVAAIGKSAESTRGEQNATTDR